MFVIYNPEKRMYLHRHAHKGWTLMVDDACLYISQKLARAQLTVKLKRSKRHLRYQNDSHFDNYSGVKEAREATGQKVVDLENAVVREVRIVPVEMKES